MEEIYPEHIAKRNPPKNLDDRDLPLFAHELSKKIRSTTIEKLKNIDIIKDTLFDKHKLKFYANYTHPYQQGLSKKQKIKRLFMFLGSYIKINKGIWVIDNWSLGYFHWFTDALPRLIASEKFIDQYNVLLPNEYEKEPYIRESLGLLNINYKFFDSNKRLIVNELVLPSHTALTGNYNKEIITKVRDKFFLNNDISPYRKIYISRRKATKRKLINEEELIVLLESYNFEIHCFEEYSFSEQLHIMQHTTHITGLHGSGLTNMLFMPRKGKILELRNSGDAHNNCYFSLASDLDHDYYYLLCDGDSTDTHDVNVIADLKKLKEIIEEMTS